MNDKFQDSLYLYLELVRAGVMHGNLWSGRAFSGGPSFGTGTYHSNNLFCFPPTPFLPTLSCNVREGRVREIAFLANVYFALLSLAALF